jgi:hypothetical protein
MSRTLFERLVAFFGVLFLVAFVLIVLPEVYQTKDVIGAFAAGFVNPFSTGYALDAILCAAILITWVIYERSALHVRHGWIVIPLCFAPGVATAFAVYLLIRSRQLGSMSARKMVT